MGKSLNTTDPVRLAQALFFLNAAVLAINIALTFTDQVGLYDWITLAIDLVLAGFLFAAWKKTLSPTRERRQLGNR